MIVFVALSVPFELAVDFNDDELCNANDGPDNCEFYGGNAADAAQKVLVGGGGILGFSLCYAQIDA